MINNLINRKTGVLLLLVVAVFAFLLSVLIGIEGTRDNILPPPSYIGEIYPFPASTLTLNEFQNSVNAPFVALEKSSICIEVWGEGLLETGENSTVEEILARFSLSVDESNYTQQPHTFIANSEGRISSIDPNTGQSIYDIPPGFPSILCYPIELQSGRHKIKLIYNSISNKELMYGWSFNLIED